jgi:hypothetical protein
VIMFLYSQALNPCRKAEYKKQGAPLVGTNGAHSNIKIMAKTYNDLYKKIYNFENIYQAYLQARRGKRSISTGKYPCWINQLKYEAFFIF